VRVEFLKYLPFLKMVLGRKEQIYQVNTPITKKCLGVMKSLIKFRPFFEEFYKYCGVET